MNEVYAISCLATHFNCRPEKGSIERAVYRNTTCGAGVEVDNRGRILFSASVEGDRSGQVIKVDPIETDERSYNSIVNDIDKALKKLERMADKRWREWNDN